MAQSAGIPSFIGYEYQILATVWVGLDLVVRRRCCDHVVVEPASEEDVAAHLRVDDEQASATVRSPFPGGYPVEIQIKLHRSGHWTVAPFTDVLQGEAGPAGARGPAKRNRPIQNLAAQPALRYTLLTDARVNDALESFRVTEIGGLSAAGALPGARMVVPDPPGTARRIGVLTEQTPELLGLRIAEILRLVHVPGTKRDACQTELQQMVRERLLGKRPNRWGVDEIESAVREHDGFPERRQPTPLVRPSNYADLQARLAANHVLLVTGPPGSGKTHVASHLAQEHRLDDEPYEVVEIQGDDGIGKVRARLDSQGRILFFIHDPWGMYEAGDRAQEWATELPKLLRRAGAGKKFLITSRTAVKEEHVPAEFRNLLTAADVAVTEANYSEADRADILRVALRDAGAVRSDYVAKNRLRIVDQLRLPLSLESFAQGLLTCPMEPEPRLDDLIRASNVGVIGRTIQQEVEARGDEAISGAVVLWARFSPRQLLSPEGARQGGRDAAQGGYGGRADPEQLLDHFVRAKRLTPAADGISYYAHPTFIEGLDRVVQANPRIADDVLSALLAGMCAGGRAGEARGILRHLKRRNTPIPAQARAALHRHLVERLGKADRFAAYQAFADLAEYGDRNAPVVVLARALTAAPARRRHGFSLPWKPAEMAPTEVKAIKRSAEAFAAARIFVRLGLLDHWSLHVIDPCLRHWRTGVSAFSAIHSGCPVHPGSATWPIVEGPTNRLTTLSS